MQEWYLGWGKGVLFRDWSSVQGVLIEWFDCTFYILEPCFVVLSC